MTIVSTLASAAISLLERFTTKTTVVATVAGISVTAGGLETAAGSLGGFLSAFEAAVKAKNYVAGTEIALDEALVIAADLGVPYAGIGVQVLPFVFGLVNMGLLPAIASLVPVDGGKLGYVTKAWAADPREALNPDGSFKQGGIFP